MYTHMHICIVPRISDTEKIAYSLRNGIHEWIFIFVETLNVRYTYRYIYIYIYIPIQHSYYRN